VADNKATTQDWILLREARELITEFYQAPALAERMILERLETGTVRWRCWKFVGYKRQDDSDPKSGDPAFWQDCFRLTGIRVGAPVVRVNWVESSAVRNGRFGYTAFRIEVPRADILTLLPADPGPKSPQQEPLLPIDRVKAVLPAVYLPEGRPPAISLKAITRAVAEECKRRNWKPPEQDTVHRALVDLGFRPPRKGR
jgi:hypothetical protein